MPKLYCKRVTFYSQEDEESFFYWINNINCIRKFDGEGDTIILHIKTRNISNVCLRELLALFHRYKIDMKQLSQFHNDSNRDWFFENKSAYWHRKVFQIDK